MSKIPLFKLPKISHNTVKERKDFIMDMTFVSVGITLLYVALNETFSEGTKELHKNKDRKELKKIKEVYEKFNNKKELIYSMMDKKDMATLDAKFKGLSVPFIKTLSMTDIDVNLHYLAISVLEQGLLRKNRKTKLNSHLDMFIDFNLLYGEVMANVEKAKGYTLDNEWKLASDFIKIVKY